MLCLLGVVVRVSVSWKISSSIWLMADSGHRCIVWLGTEVKVYVAQSCPTLGDPMDCIHGILQARILEWVAFPLPGDLPNPGIEPMSPPLQADSLPAEPPGKPKNTGVGSLSLLQRIFPTQGSNPDLLHCRRILREAQEYWNSEQRKTLK